jgi:hypothetical protein
MQRVRRRRELKKENSGRRRKLLKILHFFVFMIKKHLSVESTCSEDKPNFGRTAKALAFHIFARFLRLLCVAF